MQPTFTTSKVDFLPADFPRIAKKFSPENGLKSGFDLFEEVFFFLKGAE
ncbi:hypothetical protein Q6699_001966 [Vibrio vulnificus]|nr:hypothetical protein [Vibrio vulnificus]